MSPDRFSAPSAAIFGGSFDPPHNAHLEVARLVASLPGLQRLFIVPAGMSPFKKDFHTGGEDRLEMAGAAFSSINRAIILDHEIRGPRLSFTIETVDLILGKFQLNSIGLVIGSDLLPGLPAWKEAERLATLVHLLVIPRPGHLDEPVPHPFHGMRIADEPIADVSSTEIRAAIAAGGLEQLSIPNGVRSIIRDRALYQSIA